MVGYQGKLVSGLDVVLARERDTYEGVVGSDAEDFSRGSECRTSVGVIRVE